MSKQVVIELEAKADKAISEIEDLKKEIIRLNKAVVDSNDKTTEGIKNVETATKGTTKQIKNLGAFIGKLGLGLLIASFEKVKEIFKSSQPVVDLFNTAFEFLGLAFKDFVDFISSNWESATKPISDFFSSKTGQSIQRIGKLIGVELITRTKNLIQGIGGLGKALVKVFKGDFSGAADAAKEAFDNFGDALVGNAEESLQVEKAVENITKKVANYVKETVNAAKANVELNKSAAEARILRQGLIEQYDREAEKLRQVRDEERNTIAERIEANNKLAQVLDKQEEQMLKTVDAEIAAAQAAFDRSGLEEDRLALIEAQQEKTAVLAQIEGFRSEQLSNDLALQREQIELTESITESENARAIAQAEFLADQIEGEYLRLEAQKAVAEEEARLEEERLTKKRNQYKEGTQAYIDANNELLDFQQENNQKQIELDKQLQLAKQQLIGDALSNIAAIVGENSKFGKGIAVVQAIRDTFAGANKAMSTTPFPFNFVAAAATVAAGIANVKQITATQEPSAPSFARSAGGGFSAPSVPTPPQINTVGASGVNQLAETINAQNQKPIKAFVVSGEVTTAQSLERNAVKEASI